MVVPLQLNLTQFWLTHLLNILKAINYPNSEFFQSDEEIIYFQKRFLNTELQVMFSELDVEITRDEILNLLGNLKIAKVVDLISKLISFSFTISMCYYHVCMYF